MYPKVPDTQHLRKIALLLWLFGVLLISGRKPGLRIPNYAGQYRLLVSKVTNVSEDHNSTGDIWIRFHTTQVRGKQVQYGWGQAQLLKPISDNMKVEGSLATRSNNQWKKNAFVFKFDRACTTLLVQAKALSRLLLGGDHNNCPFPVIKLREIKNQSVELTFPKFPVMPFGQYLATFLITQRGINVALVVADLDIVPRL